jgi:diaminopimelate epimerase
MGADGQILVDMGPARLDWRDIPLAAPSDTLHLPLAEGPVSDPAACSMGNPHATFFVPDLAGLPIETIGPKLEHAPIFPDRANIGFAQILAPDRIRLRVWERGAGLTLACGSGACATLVNAVRRGLAARRATIIVDGGELLIEWRQDGHVLMTGPVATAFRGSIDLTAFPP